MNSIILGMGHDENKAQSIKVVADRAFYLGGSDDLSVHK